VGEDRRSKETDGCPLTRSLESMDEIVNEWEGISIFLHDGVECLIVLNKTELTIFLLDEEDWSTNQGFKLSDATGREGFLLQLGKLSCKDFGRGSTNCKGNLTDLRRILHLSLAKGNPK
jgi:hypothetical protein